MSSENISPDKEVLLEGTLAGFDYRELKLYLIVGGSNAVDFLLKTRDENMNEYFRQIGGKVFRILDENLVTVLQSTMFSLCGNCYSHANETSLKGIVRQGDDQTEFILEKVSMARIVDDEGRVFDLEL